MLIRAPLTYIFHHTVLLFWGAEGKWEKHTIEDVSKHLFKNISVKLKVNMKLSINLHDC